MIPSTNLQMGKARAGDVSMCPKLQSDSRPSFIVTWSVSCLLCPSSNLSSSFLTEARGRVFLFQCLLVPPITLRFRTSPFLIMYTLYILKRTPSPNLICATCRPFPPFIMNNLASELEKTLKILHIFFKKDVRIFALICLSHAFLVMNHVSSCKHLQYTRRHVSPGLLNLL